MHVSEADEKSDFAFRCHRVTEKVNGRERQKLHPVNSIVFNKQTGAFATAGGDGTVQFWDKENKQRLSQIPQVPLPVVDTTLCNNGSIFAYAQSYGYVSLYVDDMHRSFPQTSQGIHPTFIYTLYTGGPRGTRPMTAIQ